MHPTSVDKIITRRLGANQRSLRHAAATSAYRGTRDLRAAQDFLGYSSLATTERDLHVGLEAVRSDVRSSLTGLPHGGGVPCAAAMRALEIAGVLSFISAGLAVVTRGPAEPTHHGQGRARRKHRSCRRYLGRPGLHGGRRRRCLSPTTVESRIVV